MLFSAPDGDGELGPSSGRRKGWRTLAFDDAELARRLATALYAKNPELREVVDAERAQVESTWRL